MYQHSTSLSAFIISDVTPNNYSLLTEKAELRNPSWKVHRK